MYIYKYFIICVAKLSLVLNACNKIIGVKIVITVTLVGKLFLCLKKPYPSVLACYATKKAFLSEDFNLLNPFLNVKNCEEKFGGSCSEELLVKHKELAMHWYFIQGFLPYSCHL